MYQGPIAVVWRCAAAVRACSWLCGFSV